MSVYTVHAPPRRDGDDPMRFVFVRDGFAWSAFLFAPLWMLRHRLWLALILYLVLATGLMVALGMIGASVTIRVLVVLLLDLLVGFEAASLRRWTYARRGWSNLGVVAADDIEAAERRFFDAWVSEAPPAASRPPAPPRRMPGTATPDVIGLFPQPGARP